MSPAELLSCASRILYEAAAPGGYALAYGSHARATATPQSDLDLLLVTDTIDEPRLHDLIEQVKQLHVRHGLALDEEVAYEVKLCASHDDVTAAVRLRGFPQTSVGDLIVHPVPATAQFLNSPRFKYRLTLTALAGPHTFLGGNQRRFGRDRRRAYRALAMTALSLLNGHATIDSTGLVAALITHPVYAVTGEDHLGYSASDSATLYGIVQLGLADLTRTGVVAQIDATTYRHHEHVRRARTAAWATETQPLGVAGTHDQSG